MKGKKGIMGQTSLPFMERKNTYLVDINGCGYFETFTTI